MKLDPYLTSHTKVNSKWIEYVNVRHNTVKLLEKNIGESFIAMYLAIISWI